MKKRRERNNQTDSVESVYLSQTAEFEQLQDPSSLQLIERSA